MAQQTSQKTIMPAPNTPTSDWQYSESTVVIAPVAEVATATGVVDVDEGDLVAATFLAMMAESAARSAFRVAANEQPVFYSPPLQAAGGPISQENWRLEHERVRSNCARVGCSKKSQCNCSECQRRTH